jgi:peptidoglycan/LPS O-acetylase OafA/YrhL
LRVAQHEAVTNGAIVADRRATNAVGAGGQSRLAALDGLRGIAAFVVVVHHALLTWTALADQYHGPNWESRTWWLAFSPLHLLWAGREAVIIFFILSGLVLVLPYLSVRRRGTWAGYYVRRLLRLYPPVAVAVILSGLLVAAFPRTPGPGSSWWFAYHDVPVTVSDLAHDLLLVDGTGMINSVLWSLRHEVLFSLLLPVAVLVARRVPPRLALTVPAALLVVALGQLSLNPVAQWLPVFLVGVALAVGRDELHLLGARIERSACRSPIWCLLWVVTAGLLLTEWWARALAIPMPLWLLMPMVSAGGALVCFIVLSCPVASRACSGLVLQWAGRISFSLYLVHEPVVVSVSSIVGPSAPGVAVTLVVGGGLSVLLAVLFHKFVEAPSQRWSHRLGKRVDRRLGKSGDRRSPPQPPVRADLAIAGIGLRPRPVVDGKSLAKAH